uniref:Serine/threonine-protein phosphatase 4 regulatory subunit 1-like n=1 Tax=Erpetoichthys calabaricus TaxID=27687 RepID=A0A8C4S5Y1_ERPCA
MAGLSYFEDAHDDLDDFGFDDYGGECDGIRITAFLDAGQDNLTPLGRLEKYAFSENVFNRQIVARGLLDVLREFSDNENDFLTVMETVSRMSEDCEPTVRAELMEQLPNIAMFLHESRPNFPVAFSRYLVPIVVRYLTDPNNQVRKTSQAALLVLLEQGVINKRDVESKVCPVLLELTTPNSDDDYKIEAVAIMCKLVSMLTRDTVEYLLLRRFCDLCSDSRLFQVRKVCASNFGDFCTIVGQDATEKLLIAKFFELCSDTVWGVRKACAECFMTVSNCASAEVRRTKLSPLFINLISDPSRWVRQAAFQSLGRFISTFASSAASGLPFKEQGALCEIAKCSSDLSRCNNLRELSDTRDSQKPPCMSGNCTDAASLSADSCHAPKDCVTTVLCNQGAVSANTVELPLKEAQKIDCSDISEDSYSTFNYWRPLLPDISLELEQMQREKEDVDEQSRKPEDPATSAIQKVLESLQHRMDDPDVLAQVQVLSAALKVSKLESEIEEEEEEENELLQKVDKGSLDMSVSPLQEGKEESIMEPIVQDEDHHASEQTSSSDSDLLIENAQEMAKDPDLLFDEEKTKVQDVIPQQLLDQYLSMTDPARAQTVDTEIAKHCAFSLPGVALTLGRQNWHCLKGTYETLATDVQWKVRRTLAFSIHELAVILGDQLTAADLVPIFNGFLKDLDEVRIGVLKHLYDFLKLLHADKRREYLFQLQEFMVTDNSRNWRFRYELAEQLILIVELYSHNDVYDYLRQIALTLCSDKVAQVRWISYKLVVEILRKFYLSAADELGLNFINELIVRFCHSPKWVGRQAFAFICQAVVEEDFMPMDQFSQNLLPSLLGLSADPVANVRVLVAKALRQTVLEKAYFKEANGPHYEAIEETVITLQSDRDRDVRYFATLEPSKNAMDTFALI